MTKALLLLFQIFCAISFEHITSANTGPEDGSINSFSPKGTPFGKIKGPVSKNDRILIVGAGPSGIHMALKLKEMGFKHVTIFESSDRIGGKSYTVYHRYVPHEMGTCYTQPDFHQIFKLVHRFDAGTLKPLPFSALWEKGTGGFVKGSGTTYILDVVHKVKGISDPSAANAYFLGAVARYAALHQHLFGTYEGELMPRPSATTMKNISFSFMEFLKRNDLEVLKAIFVFTQTTQGYGHLDEIPALYGLMWNTPRFLKGMLETTSRYRTVTMLSKGFQFLWQEIARQSSLDVKLYHRVVGIRRIKHETGYHIDVCYRKFRGSARVQRFDFLILTPTMKNMLNQIDFRKEDPYLFSKTHSTYFTTTVLNTDYGINRPTAPVVRFLNNLLSKKNNVCWALRDSYAALNNITGTIYSNGSVPGGPDGKFIQTSVFYQMADVMRHPNVIKNKLQRFIRTSLGRKVFGNPIKQITWRYFPRYSTEDLASGMLWDIYDLQGTYNTWYIGSSVCFESVKSVVEYNLLLLRNYDAPI